MMRPVITPEEAHRLDTASDVPVDVLMDRAGLGVALAAVEMGVGYGSKVVVLTGRGNNGGDGYVAARYLKRRGVDVCVRSLGYPKGDFSPARTAAVAAVRSGVPVETIEELCPVDLVIDALFGVGFHGTMPPEVQPWLDHEAPVLSVDLPSGLNGLDGSVEGDAFAAARTVTFDAAKVGHFVGRGPDHTGALSVVPIGLADPDPAFLLCDDDDAPVPSRPVDAHKWSVGSVAVVGGSAGMVGAAVMAAEAALNFGAGAVRLVVPSGVRAEAATLHPGLLTQGLGGPDAFGPADAGPILDALGRFDVLVLGPGIGRGRGDLIAELLERWDRTLVLDADGITGASVGALASRTGPTVITPHVGEFERLTGGAATASAAFELAGEIGATVVLKGSPTFIGGQERWAVDSGGPELATIGTGDVLAGMIGALVARGLSPEVAARSAAHRHGVAGSVLAGITSVTATGLLSEIGRWAN
jgi:ADP-dependent NAD(P)H-hydrate dehydratase / NAD(P)H-hydrate epimerase